MVNWQSPDIIAANAVAFDRFMHCLLGLYMWEFATSLDFDWQFISGKKRFKWPLMFYFAGRYCLLFALIGIAIALNVTTEVNCQALYTFNQVFGNAAIGLASINLSLRTIAVWSQNKYIIVLLVIIILGHWSFLLHGILLKAQWVGGACQITSTSNEILAISFIYSMVFDFLVLCLTAWKLAFPANGRSRLVGMIFGDGLIYFVIAFLANLIATTFMLLNLNAVMSIIANVPAAIASTIVACRAVRRLTNYTTRGAEMFNGTTTGGSTLAFRSATLRPLSTSMAKKGGDSVHVQMENLGDSTSETPVAEYDAAGRIIKGDDYDPEAQIINDDFKRPPY
ncbi:hypothetical protein CONPUDRAFT_167603 [Coniophora puteana RWD-64-598 SS2]|uniref:Uncharacterized protein n=1 Tax=Coniophora puteana (strain RWD-64-598) TaxID=741705 RepID=A0A5M3MIM7_CONPW|nr:uncharacterized protein CONPUDRAFT_167603 [Coniophora puteana RWD-64-598 SS2]EIW78634.1 hypothetical protein CONPUDRAFT_167603 [Coniophora puteana RWD-64-598 SS2]